MYFGADGGHIAVNDVVTPLADTEIDENSAAVTIAVTDIVLRECVMLKGRRSAVDVSPAPFDQRSVIDYQISFEQRVGILAADPAASAGASSAGRTVAGNHAVLYPSAVA